MWPAPWKEALPFFAVLNLLPDLAWKVTGAAEEEEEEGVEEEAKEEDAEYTLALTPAEALELVDEPLSFIPVP